MAALCAAAAGAGCNLDWEKPDASLPPPERFREAAPKSAPPIAAARDFSAKFGSKEPTGIVEQALDQNLDIAAAVARIDQADAQARVASAALWPSVTMNDFARRTRTPGTVTGRTVSYTVPVFTPDPDKPGTGRFSTVTVNQPNTFKATFQSLHALGLNASYEIDFWGKNEDASNAARILANASRFDRDVVEIATIAAVLNAYFQMLAAQDQLRIAHENVAIANRVFLAIKARLDVGTATALDYSQQEAVLAGQRATIPTLEQTLLQTKNTLAVLLGRAPEGLEVRGGALTRLSFPVVAPGLPSEVLLRRPDVAAAEARLASQEFSVLQARAAFFPSITLTGQYGVQSVLLKNLLRPEAVAFQLAANLAQPLFDGYNLQGQYEFQKSRYKELAALYRKQIFTALADAENALIAVRETARRVKLQAEAVVASRHAIEAAEARLREGTIDVVTLSTTQTTLFQNELDLTLARLAQFQSATSLYQALGGGWSPTTREAEIARASEAYTANIGPWP
jgi:NodT family efflux transporter outer membrane factor (OMF) lipoprotein